MPGRNFVAGTGFSNEMGRAFSMLVVAMIALPGCGGGGSGSTSPHVESHVVHSAAAHRREARSADIWRKTPCEPGGVITYGCGVGETTALPPRR